ncbi:MAG: hypothetical protein KBT03_03245 [Bacteroidales bacterium]|nr:hypothetical protein [Candidatus Scybalousia scybalohippi]
MEVKTESGGTFNAAGQGTTALGIVGTALGSLGLLGGMGGLLGGNGLINVNPQPKNCDNNFVTEKYATLFAEYKSLQAERYTDQAVIAQAEKEAVKDAKLAQDLLDIGIGVTKLDQQIIADRDKSALREQILELKIQSVEDKIKCNEEKFRSAIALESERRTAGDQNLYNYVNGTFVPGKLIMPATSICPEPMPLKNSWTAPTA